eukprot:1675073-Lingulodinium_polyedra.AAC.1
MGGWLIDGVFAGGHEQPVELPVPMPLPELLNVASGGRGEGAPHGALPFAGGLEYELAGFVDGAFRSQRVLGR